MAPAQGKSDSDPSGSYPGKAPLAGPSKSHEASSSQQNTIRPQKTPTPTGAQTSDAHNSNETQVGPIPYNSWDGIIVEKPNFPLSEIAALKRCNFSVLFYAYVRLNGRTGVIARDLIMDILEKCSPMADTEPEPNADQGESKIERRKSKGKGKAKEGEKRQTTAAPHVDIDAHVAANIDQAAEFETPCQTFEQVCKDLHKCIEGMDMSGCTQSERQQTRVCLDTIRAVSDSAKELAKRSLAQLATAAAGTSSSFPMPSAINPKTHCVVPRPPPLDGEPCGRPLPCVAHSNREGNAKKKSAGKPAPKVLKKANIGELGEVTEKRKSLHELKMDDDQGIMSYSRAAKAAVQYYTYTSAYPKPS